MGTAFHPLELKTNTAETVARWQAYLAGEIIDRPIVRVCAPKQSGAQIWGKEGYRERAFGDIDQVLDEALERAASTYFGGEELPVFSPSLGPDEVAVYCGGDFAWSDASEDTNWSVPFVDDWEDVLPLRLNEQHPMWQRLMALLHRAAERLEGKMLIRALDLHTNMDLLAAARGPERLCLDLMDQPEMIDAAMESSRAIFPALWERVTTAGRMYEQGFYDNVYSMGGAAMLQCDFSCMISPAMFARWVAPALEEEAAIVKHVYYHWDGPDAQSHTDALCAMPGLHTLGYVPGDGNGRHIDYLPLLKRVQAMGKAVEFRGSHEELKAAHRELKPEKAMYVTSARSPQEADALLQWFVANT